MYANFFISMPIPCEDDFRSKMLDYAAGELICVSMIMLYGLLKKSDQYGATVIKNI